MSRKNPVPEREREICKRLREFRQSIKVPRAAIARDLRVTPSRIANYEHGAVPVPYHFAKEFCVLAKLNIEWLAAGFGDPHERVEVTSVIDAEIPQRMLLSEAYEQFIKPALAQVQNDGPTKFEQAASKHGMLPYKITPIRAIGLYDREMVIGLADKILAAYVRRLPPHLFKPFSDALLSAAVQFVSSHASEILTRPKEKTTPKHLTHVIVSGNVSSVKAKRQLPGFLKELREATKERGMKSALAGFLGVPLVNVSQWLAGAREPGGEYVLQMKEWLKLPEAQRKPK